MIQQQQAAILERDEKIQQIRQIIQIPAPDVAKPPPPPSKTTKELLIWDLYDEIYADEAWWITNRCIPNDCAVQRRPDRMNEFPDHIVIWEIDENQHKRYAPMDEKKRKRELWLAVKEKPIIMLRFNPDQYVDREGHRVDSCFETTNGLEMKTNVMRHRLEILNKHCRVFQYIR